MICPAKEFFAFNLAREDFFSVNLARRLKKLPTPYLKVVCKTYMNFHSYQVSSFEMMTSLSNLFFCLDFILNGTSLEKYWLGVKISTLKTIKY